LLPRRIADAVRAGAEVGPISSRVTGVPHIKERQGTVGYLTNGLVTRVTAQEKTVAYALARFLHPELYEEEHTCRKLEH
jgi:non-canonical (house-cleaning) NTP pyrophosphatase